MRQEQTERPATDPALATRYRTITVDGLKIFYREAGRPQAPALCCTAAAAERRGAGG